MTINQGVTLDYAPWTDRELLALRSCMSGLWLQDQKIYYRGWTSLIRIPPLRLIGGLALGINMLGLALEADDELISEPTTIARLCDLLPKAVGMPPSDMEDTLAICMDINEELTWRRIYQIGMIEVIERMLIASVCLSIRSCELSQLPVEKQLGEFWEALVAPVIHEEQGRG